MSRKANELLAKRVFHYYENVSGRSKSITANHFALEGKRKTTIYHIIKKYEESNHISFKKLPGRPVSQSTPKRLKKISKILTNNPSTSVCTAATKLNIPKSTL